jgi:hypothetical protein
VTNADRFRPITLIAALLLASLLSSGTTWAMPPRCSFDPGFIGQQATPASGPDVSLVSAHEFKVQSDLSDSTARRKSKWPDEAHGWGKAAIYGIEFAGAAVPLYASVGLMALLIPKGGSWQDPEVGVTAFGLLTVAEALSPGVMIETGRLLHQHGDVPNTCIGCCSGLLLATLGGLAASELKGAPLVIVAVPLAILQPALTVIGYNSRPQPPEKKKPPRQ